MATVAAGEPEPAVKLDWLSCIDSSTLSQSELHALSLSTSFNLPSSNPLLPPKIDPSLFNESAGSRRQIYSRPQSSPSSRRRRLPGLLPAPKLPSLPSDDRDNRIIIDYLKQLIREDPKFDQVLLFPPSLPVPDPKPEPPAPGLVRKRKRGRKPKVRVNLEDCYKGMEILNKNGVPVDLFALANVEHPFAEELRRRTAGLKGEEELLGFLRDLAGQWGSRRRKRRIVDAAGFGDALPLGWKLLLGLKRKDGRAWIYCRRYLSPSGQQFVSCREVASYLQSISGHGDTQMQVVHRSENVVQVQEQEQRVTAENSAGVAAEDQDQRQIVATNSDVPDLSVSNERLKEVALLGFENLADVQIHDLFECHKCNMTFDEKDSYLQHLLSVHQKTTRRYRLGSSVGDGVIIKDGKFECQFCHKVFLERRRYNGHVGIHVRNYVRRVDDLPGQENVQRNDNDNSPVGEDVPSRISKMDALIEIAHNSIMEDSVVEPHSSAQLNMIPASEMVVGDLEEEGNFESPISEQQMEDALTDNDVVDDLNQQDSDHLPVAGKVEEIDDDDGIIDAKMVTYLGDIDFSSVNKQNIAASETCRGNNDVVLTVEGFDQSGIDLGGFPQSPSLPLTGNHRIPELEKTGNSGCTSSMGPLKHDEDNSNKNDLKVGLDGCKDVPVCSNVQENVVHSSVPKPALSSEQSLDCIPAFSSDKGGKQFYGVDHEHHNVNVKGSQELRLDELGKLEYDFSSAQDSLSLPDVPTELPNNTVVKGMYASSVPPESHDVMLNMDVREQLTTLCVWCGIEFNQDAVNSEIQSNSVRFMCPACKAKIWSNQCVG